MTVETRGVPLEDYMLDDRSSYEKLPTVPLPAGSEVLVGDDAWKAAMDIASVVTGHPLIAVDVYPGGDAYFDRKLAKEKGDVSCDLAFALYPAPR